MRVGKGLLVLLIFLPGAVLVPIARSADPDLCGLLKSAEVAKSLVPDWNLVSAAPMGAPTPATVHTGSRPINVCLESQSILLEQQPMMES
jgi:hypothetical protein